MADTLQVIKSRSSTRAYTDEKVTEEELKKLLHAALQAPTAANRQEFHISVLEGNNPLLKELEEETRKTKLAAAGDETARAAIKNNPNNFYYDAPVLFFISADKNYHWSALDSGIVVENISLAAEALGLGNLIIGCVRDALSGEKKQYFANAFHFPENYEYQIAIAIGHKKAAKEPHSYDFDAQVSYVL